MSNEQAVDEQTNAEQAATKVQVIEVTNPTSDEMKVIREDIKVNFNFDVNVKPYTFNFKKSLDKATGITIERKPVELAVPYPSVAGIVAILEGGEPGDNKGLDLLLEAMENIVNTAAREGLYEDTTLTAATFPVDKLSWEFIANIPKLQRRGGGIPKEIWDAFQADYIAVMPEATGKSIEQVANAAKILVGKLASARTNDQVLEFLVGQLAVYADKSPNIEEFKDCVAFLAEKAEKLLNVTDEEMLANL